MSFGSIKAKSHGYVLWAILNHISFLMERQMENRREGDRRKKENKKG